MEKPHLGHHISQKFDSELEDVRNRVLAMGGLVEQQLIDAVRSLVEGDSELAESVETNDRRVNGMEVEIDEECTRILARRQPAASDLRLVVAVIKTITDLERIGDEAEKVARMAAHLAGSNGQQANYMAIQHLSEIVRDNLHEALDAFARMDAEAAVKIAQKDAKVDQQYGGTLRELITYMMEDPRSISRALDVLWSARALERVGDHVRNICEYVIYLVRGKDVRHISLEKLGEEAK